MPPHAEPSLLSAVHAPQRQGQQGFTLIELIIVMVMAGVLAAVALPRMNLLSVMEGPAFRDELRSSLQFARRAAMAARRNVCVSVNERVFSFAMDTREPDGISGAPACAANMVLPNPGRACSPRNDYQLCAPSTVSVSGFAGGVVFDPAGRPLNTAGAALSASLIIHAVDASAEDYSITIEAETGFVH